jgi:tetratricopeptide (TPR) repeat protein
LGSGQFDAFRELCSALLNDLKGSAQSPSVKRMFIQLTMLIPQVDSAPEISIQIGRDLVDNYGAFNSSAKLDLGTCLYRGRKFQEAAYILAEAAEQLERQGNPAEQPDLANALCILAMSRHQLEHRFQANRILEQSLEIDENLPSDISWYILVPLQVLQREARGLIQDGPIGREKQTGVP